MSFAEPRAFIAGGIAACGAVTVTHPFETVKIRLQLQGELQSKQEAPRLYRGVLHGVSVIFKNEGPKGLFRGIGAAVSSLIPNPTAALNPFSPSNLTPFLQYVYQMVLNGCRLGFYEPLRNAATTAIFRDSAVQSLGVNIFSGAASGIL
ncbi:MAG: hypothetical protein Q9190_007907, partial [Brigantiaea leucoxantha]